MNKYRLFLLSLLVITACTDYLEERQITSVSGNVYDTPEMLETHINGIIGRFITQTSFTGEGQEYPSMSSGIIHHGINGTTGYVKPYYASIYKLTQYSTSQKNNSFFGVCYGIINACNLLLDNLPASPVDPAYKTEIEGEAKFYRAYVLFRIVKIWGDCPIRIHTSTPENVDMGRSPFWEVYAQIVADLKEAERKMRSPQRAESVNPHCGRVNRYAATALLSSVYVTIGSLLTDTETNFWDASLPNRHPDFSGLGILTSRDAYALALEAAEKILPESDTKEADAPYRLATKFGDLFHWDPAFSRDGYTAYNNPERIFVLPVTNTCQSYLARYSLPPHPEGTDYPATVNTSNSGRWRPSRWVYQHWCETYPDPARRIENAKFSLWGGSLDPRLELTMWADSILNTSTKKWTKIYPIVISVAEGASINTSLVFPYFRKYWSRSYKHDAGEADSYQIRLAEIYLNAVEAAAELNQPEKAYKYMEVLHSRARHSVPDGQPDSDLPRWTPGQFGNIAEWRTAIFWERMFELLGEGHEYDEVHRHGARWISETITQPKNEFLRLPEQACFWWGGYVYPHDRATRIPYQYPEDIQELRKSLLFAYPSNELNYNNVLSSADQNPYWWGM